jgi:hypothetical protein
MVVIFALLGLIGGILFGLFNPSGAQRGAGEDASGQSSAASATASELPDEFFTVILQSVAVSQGRSAAEARASEFRAAGVEGVGVLESSRYGSLTPRYWVVYSGVFSTWQEAVDHRDELRSAHPDLAAACYAKEVTDQS